MTVVIVSCISSTTDDLDELVYKSVDLERAREVSSVLMLSNSLSSCRLMTWVVRLALDVLVSIVWRCQLRLDR